MKQSFTRWSLLLVLFVLSKSIAFAQLEPNPHLVAEDIITFAEGAVDPNNPDIWVIDMGDPAELGGKISIQLKREKGLGADYAVTLDAHLRCGNDGSFREVGRRADKEIRFGAGETTATLELDIPNSNIDGALEVAFVYFSSCNRTKIAQSLLQLNFTPTGSVAAARTSENVSATVAPALVVGQYLIFRTSFSGHVAIESDQTLRLKEWRGTTLDDAVESDEIALTPIRVGKTSRKSFYLHKLTEEMTLAGKNTEGGRPAPSYNYQLIGIDKLKDAVKNDTYTGVFPEYILEKDALLLSDSGTLFFQAPPRIESVEVSKSSYLGYELGKITVHIPNMDYYIRHNLRASLQDALDNISITLFGMEYTFKEEGWNPDTKEATLLFDVPVNTSEADSTVFAEIKVWTLKRVEGLYYGDYVYPYGAYTSFTHARGTVDFEHPIESIEVRGLPENNLIFKANDYSDYPTYQLRAVVSPEGAMCGGKWTSSNTEVATIDENTGLLQPNNKATGVTTIRFTSNEVARRAELKLDPNDEVLIREFRVVVGGVAPKISVSPKNHPYEEKTVIDFYHNFQVAGWSPTKAEIIIYDEDDNEKKKVTIGADDEGFSGRVFQYDFPYDGDLLKKYSSKDENGNYKPVYKVSFEVELENNQKIMPNRTRSAVYPVYVLYPVKPRIRIAEENLQEFYGEGKNSVTYEVGWLDSKGDFEFEYIVTGYTASNVNEFGVVTSWSSSEIGEGKINGSEATTEPEADGLSRIGMFTVEYSPNEPSTEYDYTEIQIKVTNPKGYILYSHTTQIKSKKTEQLLESFKSFNSNEFKNNWDDVAGGIDASQLSTYLEDNYDSDALYDYLAKNWPSKMFHFSYPKSWGMATLTLDDGSDTPYSYGVNHVSTFRVDYPLKGGEQTLTLSWEGKDSKSYKYNFADIENKLYGYYLTGYNSNNFVYVEYTNGKGETKSREVTCGNGYLCLYEPDGVQGSIALWGVITGDDLVYATITDVKPLGHGSVFKSTGSFDKMISNSKTLVRRPDYVIRLYDASGKVITSPATIHYMTLDKNGEVVGEPGTVDSSKDNKYSFFLDLHKSIPYNSTFTQYVEILVDGYQPQLLVVKRSDGYRANVILKGTERLDKHANAILTENNEKKSLQNYSLDDVVSYTDEAKNTFLTAWLPLTKGGTTNLTSYRLSNTKNLLNNQKSVAISRIIESENFKYDYAELTFNIDNYINRQGQAQLAVWNNSNFNSKTILPILKNTTFDPNALAKQLALPLDEGGSIDDLSDVDAGEDFKESFDNFDMTMPSTLPVTLQIVKEGDEFIVRGIYSHNFIPGGKVADQIALAADFEALFNEISSQLSEGKSYEGTNSYFSAGAFLGFKGFLAGKAVYNPNNSEASLQLDFVDIGVKAEMSASFHSTFSLIVVFGVGVDGELSAELKLAKPSAQEMQDAANPIKVNLVLTNKLELDLYAKLGFGVNLLIAEASAGVQGGGGGSHVQQIIFKPYNAGKSQVGFKTNLRAYIILWAQKRFLFWTDRKVKELANWNKEFYFPDNANNPLKTATRSFSRVGDVFTRAEIQGLTSLVEDVESNANPQYVGTDGTFVYTAINDPKDYNDDRIMVYSNNSAKEFDEDDEDVDTPAYNLSAASQGTNSLVAYEELSGLFDPNDLEDMTDRELIQIYTSQIDIIASLNGDKFNLSENDMANMKPKAAINGTHAGVVWSRGSLDVDDEMEISLNGHLVMSRYDGTEWKKYELLPINELNKVGAYSIAMAANGIALIAIEKIENEEAYIQLISVTPEGEVTVVDTGKKGHGPNIKTLGENFILSYLTAKSAETAEEDIYFALIGKDGKPAGISGFGGLSNKIPQNYQLIVAENATKLSDVSVLWNESKINQQTDQIESAIFAAKLGTNNEQFYTSQPTKVFDIPKDVRVHSYDGYVEDNTLKAVACLGNDNLGASIVEAEIDYANSVTLLAEHFPYSNILPEAAVKVGFSIGNDGYLPVKAVKVKIGEADEQVVEAMAMPRYSSDLQVGYTIPASLGTVDYAIIPVFDDGTDSGLEGESCTGSFDLSTIDLGVKRLSTNTLADKTTVLLEVANNTPFPLTGDEEITLGLYTDIRGEELYSGTSVQVLSAEELYADNENLSVVIPLTFDQPKESLSLYAIVKTAEVRDLNTLDNSAIIPLFVDTKSDPDATYYTVSIPEVEGVKIDPSKDAVVQENGSLTVTVTALEGYNLQNMVFYVNGVEKAPDKVLADGSMQFTISPITGDVTLTITGVNKGTVSNIVLIDGLKMYTEPGYLVIENTLVSDSPENIVIYNVQGKLLVKQDLPTGVSRIPMDSGVYLIVIKDKSYKVYI
ncbi:Ig-like domain-containing protein [Parabacteroides sp. PF5-6]|uniref:Ig-like domain-containing protein n=1 Tax=Parabacteroides sp. PF5-6 TaxID=1742403 RepID=UPI002406A3DF|nr:Ig-like domain-containing protein [Parabacteroides sp. PF5-6]MDF9830811.1 hypothetical protein [Parabacteroides sp. PF5-6]